MAAVSLFGDTNMAAVTSCENTIVARPVGLLQPPLPYTFIPAPNYSPFLALFAKQKKEDPLLQIRHHMAHLYSRYFER